MAETNIGDPLERAASWKSAGRLLEAFARQGSETWNFTEHGFQRRFRKVKSETGEKPGQLIASYTIKY